MSQIGDILDLARKKLDCSQKRSSEKLGYILSDWKGSGLIQEMTEA